MTRVASIFSQILQLVSRLEFETAVRKYSAERHSRGFSSWGQFVAMLFCQLGHAKSLREICGGLAASEGKLRHLGLPAAPARSTLAYANEHRPWQVYKEVFEQLLEKCQALAAGRRAAPISTAWRQVLPHHLIRPRLRARRRPSRPGGGRPLTVHHHCRSEALAR